MKGVRPGSSFDKSALNSAHQICKNSHPNETALCQSSPAQAADPLVTQRTDKNTTQHNTTHASSFLCGPHSHHLLHQQQEIRNRYRMATFGRSIGLEAGSGYPCHDSICLKPPSPDSLSAQLSAKTSKHGDVAGTSDYATEVRKNLVLCQSRRRG